MIKRMPAKGKPGQYLTFLSTGTEHGTRNRTELNSEKTDKKHAVFITRPMHNTNAMPWLMCVACRMGHKPYVRNKQCERNVIRHCKFYSY